MKPGINKTEEVQLSDIDAKYYMKPIIKKVNALISTEKDKAAVWKRVFDKLHNLMLTSKDSVDKLLIERRKAGLIKDMNQARKSIAGAVFSNLLIYTFIKNKVFGNISSNIYITAKHKSLKGFEKIATVYVDDETQKPDCDLVIYSLKENKELKKCIILSLKTSLSKKNIETYLWRIFKEIASSDNEIKKKYNIRYNPDEFPLVAFATINFYNEINNPQHKGMFKFFDKSFIAKNVDRDFISPLSELTNYANSFL